VELRLKGILFHDFSRRKIKANEEKKLLRFSVKNKKSKKIKTFSHANYAFGGAGESINENEAFNQIYFMNTIFFNYDKSMSEAARENCICVLYWEVPTKSSFYY
jgi:hypothetical protein